MHDDQYVAAEKARRILLQRLEGLQRAGITHLPKSRRRGQPVEVPAPPATHGPHVASEPNPTSSRPTAATQANAGGQRSLLELSDLGHPLGMSTVGGEPTLPAAERMPALEIVRGEVAACTRCRELAETRTQTVFGVGNPQARLCFLGEAPGADEDRQGEPFVGKAGQLLTKIIEACTLRREDVYILNVLKCRPPGNRNPLPDETANCRGFLDRQLEIIRPEFICCLGAVAAQNLLGTDKSIGRLRGRMHEYLGAKVLCTYHPAYLLRNPEAKKDVWQDMQLLMREMGIELRK